MPPIPKKQKSQVKTPITTPKRGEDPKVRALADLIHSKGLDPEGHLSHLKWREEALKSGTLPAPKKGKGFPVPDPLKGTPLSPSDLTPTVIHQAQSLARAMLRGKWAAHNSSVLKTGKGAPIVLQGDEELDPARNKDMAREFVEAPKVPQSVKGYFFPFLPQSRTPAPIPPVPEPSQPAQERRTPPAPEQESPKKGKRPPTVSEPSPAPRSPAPERKAPEGGVSFKQAVRDWLKANKIDAAKALTQKGTPEKIVKALEKKYGRTLTQTKGALNNIKNNR